MLTKQKGDVALSMAIAYFMSNEYEVLLPIGDKRPYDLVIEKGGLLSRVQVKYAGLYASQKCIAALRVMGGNQSYYTAKKYEDTAFDYLFVYSARHEAYLFPWREVAARNAIRVEVSKYAAYKVSMQG